MKTTSTKTKMRKNTKNSSTKSKRRNKEKTDNSASEAKDPKVEAVQQDANLDEAEVRTVSDATAALAAAEDGKSIKRVHAEAPAGTAAAAEAQEKTEKEEEIRALIQERKTTAKHENGRIREISKKSKEHQRK